MAKSEEIRYSVSPSGEKFALPTSKDDAAELKRIETLVTKARKEKKEIVVVMGVGFGGTCQKRGHRGKSKNRKKRGVFFPSENGVKKCQKAPF